MTKDFEWTRRVKPYSSTLAAKINMTGLSDFQLRLVWDALKQLPTERERAELLHLIDEQLKTRTVDLEDAISRGMRAVSSDVSS